MVKLEELKQGCIIRGLIPRQDIIVVDVKWYGNDAVELTYKDSSGKVGNQLIFRSDEERLKVITEGQAWSFEADGKRLRLVSEAKRICLAYLFDPYLAIHTSMIDPLPHQISAVYEKMLPRQPLRFLLADDPGAGKTIMAGLYIKELMIRGDLQRCLIVCPGNLTEQWQDELWQRFQLPFELLTNDRIESSRTGNIFQEMSLVIARLDKLARNENLQEKLAQIDWDLIVVDEAHKMSATYFGGEARYTKRYRLGKCLSQNTRHFLLMTATPHNGKEEDFQLFMSLLDPDQFEGRYRPGVHDTDVSNLMRRMLKEELLKFDGTRLFPERRAYTVTYKLSDSEINLYQEVTEYVREEFNRVERLKDPNRKGTVGFALTILQRRLASSPEAIYQSLKRRRERLESRLREAEMLYHGSFISPTKETKKFFLTEEEVEELQDLPAEELETLEEEIIDQATAAQTIEELCREIDTLKHLETLALAVRRRGIDRKWEELSKLLQEEEVMFDRHGRRRKLVIFTEHRDTLNYLISRIRNLLGCPEKVVTIHGGMRRDQRRFVQEQFTQNEEVTILVATDAAGEGINLQRAHLMINYDLPWNPNRIEQRFGRIHRIGQTEVCHLWNLVAEETREGDVYLTLLEKLEQESKTLGGAVFDVLGKAIDGKELRQLIIEAIRYGDKPEVRASLKQKVEGALNRERLESLIQEKALAHEIMDVAQVFTIKKMMERMEALRLQPHFISAFFKAAFKHLGGTIVEREPGRYQLRYVPAVIRERGRRLGFGDHILRSYERICFEKELRQVSGKPTADFVAPGHPLLDTVINLILERYQDLMKQGAILVDEKDSDDKMRALFYLEHAICDAHKNPDGSQRVVSKKLQFIEMVLGVQDFVPQIRNAGPAPYLDYRPLTEEEKSLIADLIKPLRASKEMENQVLSYAVTNIVPQHLEEIRERRAPIIEKTRAAVKERLTKEIIYWNNRALELEEQEKAGKFNARLNSTKARRRAEELQERLERRLRELEEMEQLFALPPVVTGGALVVPLGLLNKLRGKIETEPGLFAKERKLVERLAMAAVMAIEHRLGHNPIDVSQECLGYDIESVIPLGDGREKLRFIEVKGRVSGAPTVTITRNEILCAFNKPDDWVLALVEVPRLEEFELDPEATEFPEGMLSQCRIRYVWRPFSKEPDFAVTSVNYDWGKLWNLGMKPF